MEPSPNGERSHVLSLPTTTQNAFRPASSRATPSPASDAPMGRDGFAVSSPDHPAGLVQPDAPSPQCAMPLVPAMAGSGRHDRLATSAMGDGNNRAPVVVTSAVPARACMQVEACISASCAQNVPHVQEDRPSDRVVARRRGAQHSQGTALANLPIRGAYAQQPARPNGAASSAGCVGQDDSGPVCAHKAQGVQNDRPRASVVSRPCDADVPNRTDIANPSPRGPISEQPACSNSAPRRSGSVDQYDSGHVCAQRVHSFQHGRPRASVVARQCDVDVRTRTTLADPSPADRNLSSPRARTVPLSVPALGCSAIPDL